MRPRGSTHFLVLMSLAGKLVLGIIMQSILIEGKRIELKIEWAGQRKNILPVECTHCKKRGVTEHPRGAIFYCFRGNNMGYHGNSAPLGCSVTPCFLQCTC